MPASASSSRPASFAYDDLAVIASRRWVRHGVVLARAFALLVFAMRHALPATHDSFLRRGLGPGRRPAPPVSCGEHRVVRARAPRSSRGSRSRWWPPLAAALAGILFAVHPVHVEAAANVVGRAELLAATALLTLAVVASTPRPPSLPRLVVIGFLSAAALCSKETGVVAPLIVWATARLRRDLPAVDVRRMTGAALLGIAVPLVQRVIVLGTVTGDSPHPAFAAGSHAQ